MTDKSLHHILDDFAAGFHERRLKGLFSLTSARTVSDIALLLKYAVAKLPLEDFWVDFKGTMSPIDLLSVTLGRAIDELSRPIDAIRHQAKTVTVGTSRKEEHIRGILFDLIARLEFSTRNLSGKNILTLSRVQRAVSKVRGYTIYEVKGLDAEGKPSDSSMISIRARGGISLGMKSRAERGGALLGTKKHDS